MATSLKEFIKRSSTPYERSLVPALREGEEEEEKEEKEEAKIPKHPQFLPCLQRAGQRKKQGDQLEEAGEPEKAGKGGWLDSLGLVTSSLSG